MGFQDVVSAAANLAPYHLLSYSTLIGMSIFQSFTVVKTAHRVLPRPAFTTLQARLFPIYFQLQTLYFFLTAATFPPYGPVSLIKDGTSAALFSVAGTGVLLNFFVYGPRTRQAMIDRSRKAGAPATTTDEDVEEASEEAVEALNKSFHKSHAMSLHINLITMGALVVYGWRLALRLKVE
ncbi:hypothetical protein CONLIGDRAFT_587083 [Coniochaeta ligniaria NRRL 30616]|uniref:TMEM205-like domain-containing protein n=1 Tax=Coniochaeta ligniaria NRRL 30616 TaxID=1408157 RepID=A0A1J7I4V4_9PEZI|nr:hypothetical protein CONLIGDRAFT_587083 [Coniochaeta ligniaria NRRL 30616]